MNLLSPYTASSEYWNGLPVVKMDTQGQTCPHWSRLTASEHKAVIAKNAAKGTLHLIQERNAELGIPYEESLQG